MAHDARPGYTPTAVWVIATCLLLWIITAVTLSQWRMSPTFDEQNHVTRGIAILQTGDYRLCFHHPPLANILEGLPVAWLGQTGFSTAMPAWTTLSIWDASRETLWEHSTDGAHLVRLARIPVLLFTLVLALVIFLWSRELFGPWGGVFSLGLFALDPNVLAHSGLATTDLAAACTITLAMYLIRRYFMQPGWPRLLYAGVGVGLAFSAKFSSLILVPIVGVLLIIFALVPPRTAPNLFLRWGASRWWRRFFGATGHCLLVAIVGGAVLWGIYGFKVEQFGAKPGQVLPASASTLDRAPIPALQYLRGLKTVKSEAEGHRAYLLGKTDTTGKGWWYYFPVAVGAKTPLPELLAILGVFIFLAIPRLRAKWDFPRYEWLFLLVPAGVYLLAGLGLLGISLNLGIRHMLPFYPFLLIAAGSWAVCLPHGKGTSLLLSGLLLLQLASVMTAYPNFLAYFNEIAGGADNGYTILADSNYDWGQDLGELARVQKEKGLYPLAFSYFGTTPPTAYNISCTPLPTAIGIMTNAPSVGVSKCRYLAISATNLVGGPAYARKDYRYLLQHTPYLRVGKTIFVYQLPLNE